MILIGNLHLFLTRWIMHCHCRIWLCLCLYFTWKSFEGNIDKLESASLIGQDDDDTRTVQSQPLPRDAFRIRQFQKARRTASQTGSASYGSALSGDLSGSNS